MNVLEKISGIEICPDTRISEQDRQFCIICYVLLFMTLS